MLEGRAEWMPDAVQGAHCNGGYKAPNCTNPNHIPQKGTTREHSIKSPSNEGKSPKIITPYSSRRKTMRHLIRCINEGKQGKDVNTGISIDGHEIVFRQGNMSYWGTSHAEREAHKNLKVNLREWRELY